MSLTVGLDIARKGLAATAEQTSVVTRNVTRAGETLATRKTAHLTTIAGGGAQVVSITRATNTALFNNLLGASADSAAQQAIAAALSQLDGVVGDPELQTSPAALIGKLRDSLTQLAAEPSDAVRAQAVVVTADTLAKTLVEATTQIRDIRARADLDMNTAVDRINDQLAKFDEVNREIIKGTLAGVDVTDLLDSRDRILATLSEDIGIRTIDRANGDMAIYTDSGVPLYETRPREVTFQRTLFLSPTDVGNPVYVDGVPITSDGMGMQISSGRLTGLAQVRDELTATFQSQLDEIARGLISTFAEVDQSGGGGPALTGLFSWSGSPNVPAAATIETGLAGIISVNPAYDRRVGGNPFLIRDGGANGAAYVANTTGASGFTDYVESFVTALQSPQAFDTNAQLGTSKTLGDFAAQSIGWLQQIRSVAQGEADYRATLMERTSEALSKETGVNLDDEMTKLLELERSYQASSKLVSVIDNMFSTFMSALR